jgi:hypothetical protein
MIPVAILAFVGMAFVTIGSAIAAVLSFRSALPSWMLLIAGIPALAVGIFYTVGLAVAQRGAFPVKLVFWMNAACGLMCVVQFFWKRRVASRARSVVAHSAPDEKPA